MVKILHLGNIANNAYNNAKHLNQESRHQHFALSYDNPHVMACPEWEEIDTFEPVNEYSPDWTAFSFHRPSWFSYLETSRLSRNGEISSSRRFSSFVITRRRQLAYWLQDQGLKKRGKLIQLPAGIKGKFLSLAALPAFMVLQLLRSILVRTESFNSTAAEDNCGYQTIADKLASRIGAYQLIEAYGADIIIPYLLGRPYIAYEHGTLRDLPFDGTAKSKLLSKAYQGALYTVITNPDVISSAKKLNLKNLIFIPHAVDCDRFSPGEDTQLRVKFGIEDQLILLAPARQNWDIKGNDKYIKAFARLLETNCDARLFVCDWGQHRDLTQQLIKQLGIQASVTLYPPVPKSTSVRFYHMADIVIDQLQIGTFGGITPEAMACGKPALINYNPELHNWCFDSHPPVVSVASEDDVFQNMLELAQDQHLRQTLGAEGRRWVLREYSIEQLISRHNKVYNKVLQALA